MPKYFFHLLIDASFTPDEQGEELADFRTACARARQTLGLVIADELADAKDIIHATIMVDDQDGVRVANLKAVTSVAASESPFAQ
ncbi:MAG: hypothetical protein JWN66_3256 [Sphingomonas bacterium]|uniref:DUF6894 family protein n=1 Tax=Sphingomonas bacterium TaxID=1895847 RepID=UPI0026204B04|nr:hypothetical protein [Sphingomonas bacterium]MDB5706140.1 hypothetical protein [Sphingomonas bacterium]